MVEVRPLDNLELLSASALVKRVFDQFEAPEYSEEGIETFYDFIAPESLKQCMAGEALNLWGSFADGKIVGVIATQNGNHISLFFVDNKYHRQGIGRKLLDVVAGDVQGKGFDFITVNSSPYAVPIYHRLGFGYTDTEQVADGIRFVPMIKALPGKTLAEFEGRDFVIRFPIILSPPGRDWAEIYRAEAEHLSKLLASTGPICFFHIGSTAIPGIHAKPTIDILMEIDKQTDLQALIALLEGSDYIFVPQPDNPPPYMVFYKGYTNIGFVGQTYHLHVRYSGGLHDEVIFRDYLLSHPAIAAEYEMLKINLKEQYRNDRDAYTRAKTAFVSSVLDKNNIACE